MSQNKIIFLNTINQLLSLFLHARRYEIFFQVKNIEIEICYFYKSNQ